MGKINKFANIYDKEGNLLRHVGEDGKLKKYTVEELEELVDKLAEDKDENGNVKDPQALNNTVEVLSEEYRKHPNRLIQKLQDIQKQHNNGEATMVEKTSEEEVEKALEDTNTSMKTLSEDEKEALYADMKSFNKEELVERETSYEPDSYTDFEMVA